MAQELISLARGAFGDDLVRSDYDTTFTGLNVTADLQATSEERQQALVSHDEGRRVGDAEQGEVGHVTNLWHLLRELASPRAANLARFLFPPPNPPAKRPDLQLEVRTMRRRFDVRLHGDDLWSKFGQLIAHRFGHEKAANVNPVHLKWSIYSPGEWAHA
jgi:hypothetical protein